MKEQPTVYICNQFYNEYELLHLKLNEISLQLGKFNIPWKMIIVEATETFTHKKKNLFYADNKDYYGFEDNIINYVLDAKEYFPTDITKTQNEFVKECYNSPGFPLENPAMQNDFIQKMFVEDILKEYAYPDDIILFTDLDEIPDFRKILSHFDNDLSKIDKIYSLRLALFYSKYNTMATFRDDRVTIFPYRLSQGLVKHRGFTFQERNWIPTDKNIVAGWHFSSVGDIEFIKNKIQNFGHSELNNPTVINNLQNNIDNMTDIFSRGFQYIKLPIDQVCKDFYPEYFMEHLDFYKHNIKV